MKNDYVALTLDWGADRAKMIDACHIVVADWVRLKCRFGCDVYGVGRLCPPRVPSVDEMRCVVSCYSKGFLFTFDGVREKERRKKERAHRELVFWLEREMFLDGFPRAFGMGCGPCRLCDACNLDEPCNYPDKARPSMEALGIDVFSTMASSGMELEVIQRKKDPYSMVGLVLME
ncbi:MAG: DUF2284 domain-containing protein [bacterium]